ncbi:hypothetical protein [Winogradskyella bathintestinalis]|uniref:SprT-like domain-containing protein n=1 Tax=Winogradskyella bathintestinalis TaxID=3035208 RepID=A0ABT7ZRK1_9FLAO|nr:hypothetical protein [Winogradskyella bathintestinalis]MDN3491609.1 hypothetical protein [Winogradskyella bathintestinalis]
MDYPVKPEVQVPNLGELNFAESILALFNNSDNTDYTITNSDLTGKNAETTGASTLISNSYLANATQLSIVRTMIHEMVHAYINALYSNVVSINNFSYREKIERYAEDNGYVIGTNEFHHNFMGQYLDGIAVSLYEWIKIMVQVEILDGTIINRWHIQVCFKLILAVILSHSLMLSVN